MVLTVTEDTPADMLAGSMELLVQLPRDHHLHTQRVTVLRRYIYKNICYVVTLLYIWRCICAPNIGKVNVELDNYYLIQNYNAIISEINK